MQSRANARAHAGADVSSKTMAHKAIMPVALHLARRLTQPPWAQSRSMLPNKGCIHSQAWMRGEPRAAAQPAIKMNTVVGNPGRKMPMTPNARHSNAKSRYSQRTTTDADRLVAGGSGCGGARGVSMGWIVHLGIGGWAKPVC